MNSPDIGPSRSRSRNPLAAEIRRHAGIHASKVSLALLLALNAIGTAQAASIFDTYGSSNPIIQWNAWTVEAAKVTGAAFNTNVTSRVLAVQGIAARDAAIAASGGTGLYSGAVAIPGGPIDVNVAIAAASHAAAYGLHTTANYRTALDTRLNTYLSSVADGAAKTNGIALGAAIAGNVLALRAFDPVDAANPNNLPYSYVDPSPATLAANPGLWSRTNTAANAVNPGWGDVRPFLLSSATQFAAPLPPALTSPEYTAAYNETKSYGAIKLDGTPNPLSSTERTLIANFWRQDAELPVFQVARQVADAAVDAGQLTLLQTADLFARLGAAVADARIAIYNVKYDPELGGLFWRPVQGIRRGNEDGNPDTAGDPTWNTLIPTPNHPSFIGGNAGTAAAGAKVLEEFFGSDDIGSILGGSGILGLSTFEALSGTVSGSTPTNAASRSFTRFSDAAQESADSRIYGGIHWRFDNVASQLIGGQIGGLAANGEFTPVPVPAALWLMFSSLSGLAFVPRRRAA